MSKNIKTEAQTAKEIKSQAAKDSAKSKARREDKASRQAATAAELEGRTGPLGIFATEAVTEIETEEAPIIAPAPETLATEVELTQTEAEKGYGESTLNDLLADRESFLAAASGFEISVAEAIYRRLTKSDKKSAPILTKSTYVAAEGGVGPTKRVWEIAGEMKGAKRSEVLAACAAEGIGANTAKTQYQKFMEAGRSKLTGPKA